jgi:hypothetical protein
MTHSLKARLEEFSKAKAKKVPTFPKTYTIGVNKEIKERFNMIRKNYKLTANELLSILLESYPQ